MLDRFLFHALPDVYNRKVGRLCQDFLASSLFPEWDEALRLPGTSSLEDSFLREIQQYFKISCEDARKRLETGAEHFASHFEEISPDLKSGSALEQVYDETDLEIFELAEWHAHRFSDGPLNYVQAMRAANAVGAKTYLDYGSGIGSGAILFARAGFEVTLADVSSPMLEFARWRLDLRGLKHSAIHLRTQSLGEGVWDIVTMLDVLEHVADPVALTASMRKHLSRDRGIIVIRAPFDDERPQHIPHDIRTPSRFSSLGYRYAWDLMGRNGLPIALRPAGRGKFRNALADLIDNRIFGFASIVLNGARPTLRKLRGRSSSIS